MTEFMPHQISGGDWLAQRPRAGCFDPMGSGKTGTLIRGMDRAGLIRNMVIVPAMLRENWVREFHLWGTLPRRICKGKNIHDFIAWQRGRFDTIITSYELGTKWAKYMHADGAFVPGIHFDESQYLRNLKTLRVQSLLGPHGDGLNGLTGWAEYSWFSTGTPIPNDPADIYTFLVFCGVMPLSRDQFIRRYFHSRKTTFGSRQEVKPEMVAELRMLIENNAIRRPGPELPPIFLTDTLVDGDNTQIIALLKEHPGLEQSIIDAVAQGGLSFLDAPHVMTLRRLLGEAKAIPYSHMVANEIMSGEVDKMVTIGFHRRALEIVTGFLRTCGVDSRLVMGGVSDRVTEEAIDAFQNDPNCKHIAIQGKKGGVGLNAHASCRIDMLESGWTPESNAQPIKRIHRKGQERTCHARFITLANSFDVKVINIVIEKVRAIATLEPEEMIAAPMALSA